MEKVAAIFIIVQIKASGLQTHFLLGHLASVTLSVTLSVRKLDAFVLLSEQFRRKGGGGDRFAYMVMTRLAAFIQVVFDVSAVHASIGLWTLHRGTRRSIAL